jgi:NAD(P)H-dependent flavin oxidoreductase YrpB (nitropropane dioxygenase family)
VRVLKSKYIMDWEENKAAEIKKLTSSGVIPVYHDMERMQKEGNVDETMMIEARPLLMGQVAGVIDNILPAKQIIDEMVSDAVKQIKQMNGLISAGAKL